MSRPARRPLPEWLPMEQRKPSPAEFGLDVTIAIVAITQPDDLIVCVSDRMISFADMTPADDTAAIKSPSLNESWHVAYAANDVTVIWPIIEGVRARLKSKKDWTGDEIQTEFTSVYTARFHQEFLTKRLVRYGYKSMEEFRTNGRSDLGDHFVDICIELDRFDLGAQFLLFGYERSPNRAGHKRARIFEISSPGHITDHGLLQYAVIGSGYYMALAALRRQKMAGYLEGTIYRLLEAKFSAETATGVGKTTTMTLYNQFESMSLLGPKDIDRVRTIWLETLKNSVPQEAIQLIEELKGVENVRHT
jgi:hypothetical protein